MMTCICSINVINSMQKEVTEADLSGWFIICVL